MAKFEFGFNYGSLPLTPELPTPDYYGARFFSEERYINHLRAVSGWQHADTMERWVVTPNRLHSVLSEKASGFVQGAGAELEHSAILYLPLGGKGKIIGQPFANLVQAELMAERADVLHVPDSNTGAVDIGSEMLRRHTPLNTAADTITVLEREYIKRYVEGTNNRYIDMLRKYFTNFLQQGQRLADGRKLNLLLLDDQRGTGLTGQVAYALVEQAAMRTKISDLSIYDYTNLAPNWDHVPGYCVRAALSGGGSLPGGLVAAAEGYVLRGGYANNSDSLSGIQQFELPGHVLHWKDRTKQKNNQWSLDLSGTVRAFNEEFGLLLR